MQSGARASAAAEEGENSAGLNASANIPSITAPTTALAAAASTSTVSSPSSTSFGSFLSSVHQSGLRSIRTLDAPTLLSFAEQSLVLEEEVATGCLMIQALSLLEHFHRTVGISPLLARTAAINHGQCPQRCSYCASDVYRHFFDHQFIVVVVVVLCSVRSFYRQRSAGLATEDGGIMVDDALSSTSAVAVNAAPGVARSSMSHRDATWRAGFALRVYEVMLEQPEDYALVSSSEPRRALSMCSPRSSFRFSCPCCCLRLLLCLCSAVICSWSRSCCRRVSASCSCWCSASGSRRISRCSPSVRELSTWRDACHRRCLLLISLCGFVCSCVY